MVFRAYALLDTKVGMFHCPWFMAHPQQAIRACVDLGSDLTTIVGRHPGDYILCDVGSYDDQTGVMTSQSPVQISVVSALLPVAKGAPLLDVGAREEKGGIL